MERKSKIDELKSFSALTILVFDNMEIQLEIETSPDKVSLPSDYFGKNALFYTSSNHMAFLKSYLGCELQIIVAKKNNEIVGYIPLMFRQSEQFGTVCNSLPFFGSNGGVIIKEALDFDLKNKIREALISKTEELIKEKKCVAATIISNPLDVEGISWMEKNFTADAKEERIGQFTKLPDYNEEIENNLMAQFAEPRPRNIRRAMKAGVQISYSHSKESFEYLMKTHQGNISSIGGTFKESRFFNTIPEFFDENEFRIYTARLDGKIIASLLLFYYNKTIEYYTPATSEEYRQLQPSALLIFTAMKDAAQMGYTFWNWGGTWLSQKGVYDFKKKWGTLDFPYFYYTKIYDKKLLTVSKEVLLKEFQFFYVLPFKN